MGRPVEDICMVVEDYMRGVLAIVEVSRRDTLGRERPVWRGYFLCNGICVYSSRDLNCSRWSNGGCVESSKALSYDAMTSIT